MKKDKYRILWVTESTSGQDTWPLIDTAECTRDEARIAKVEHLEKWPQDKYNVSGPVKYVPAKR